MNLTYLKYFLVLAKVQHYGKAADQLGISQPGLSHAIASLEKNLGVTLFKKDGRNIALNRFGKMLVPEAERILSAAGRCEEQFRLIQSGGGPVRIASIRPLITSTVPALVREYVRSSKRTGQKFLFETEVSQAVAEGLKDGRYDIGFCSRMGEEPELEMIPVQRQKMVVIVPEGHRLCRRDSVALEETFGESQILFSQKSGLRPKMDLFFKKAGKIPQGVCEAEEHDVILELVAQGFGIAVMPNLSMGYRSGIRAIPVREPEWENIYYMARRKNDCRSRLEDELFEFCRMKMQEKGEI